MIPWNHQQRAVEGVRDARAQGERRICVTTPTGGGKTVVLRMLAEEELQQGGRVVLYTNRRMLIDQTSDVLLGAGVYHGIRAAGYTDELEHPFQVASIQTEHSRVVKRQRWDLHRATLVLVDECHLQTAPMAQEILRRHYEAGATIVGFTATPIDVGSIYDTLLVAGTTSELRDCGALVPAHHYGPDEPDMRAFKKLQEGLDLSEKQNRQAMMTPTIWGRVWEWFEKLNPEHRPTILFAPGVQESIWFAEQFARNGVSAAHVDGHEVWLDGQLHKTSRTLRQEILDASKAGDIGVLCNRFVLREGIDAPWLGHGIFATVFGALQSYLQSGGRLLRAFPGMDAVTIQDHGGNWWKHGSLNADRDWSLDYTATMIYGLRADRLRTKREKEPARCPVCARICTFLNCPCGYVFTSQKKSRPVVSTDGSLKHLDGDIFKPRRISQQPNGPELWEKMYFRSRTKKGERTFRQAMALYAYENNYQWPDPTWPLMPTDPMDAYRLVTDVPRERLR